MDLLIVFLGIAIAFVYMLGSFGISYTNVNDFGKLCVVGFIVSCILMIVSTVYDINKKVKHK